MEASTFLTSSIAEWLDNKSLVLVDDLEDAKAAINVKSYPDIVMMRLYNNYIDFNEDTLAYSAYEAVSGYRMRTRPSDSPSVLPTPAHVLLDVDIWHASSPEDVLSVSFSYNPDKGPVDYGLILRSALEDAWSYINSCDFTDFCNNSCHTGINDHDKATAEFEACRKAAAFFEHKLDACEVMSLLNNDDASSRPLLSESRLVRLRADLEG